MFYPSMIDQYFDTIGDDWLYEDDFGVEQTYFEDIDDELAPLSGPSFMYMGGADDEGEFYDPSETGGYAVDLEDFRVDDESEFYDPVADQANVVSGGLSFTDKLMRTLGSISLPTPAKKRPGVPQRSRRRTMQDEYGMSGIGTSGPGRLPLSGARASDTEMIRLTNFMKTQAAEASRKANLENLPLPRIGPTPSASSAVNLASPGLKPTLASRQRQAARVRG